MNIQFNGNSRLSRRSVLKTAALPMLGLSDGWSFNIAKSPKSTDIVIDEVSHEYEDFQYRTPYKFGGRGADRVTLLNVRCRVHTRNGRSAKGFGSMPLGNLWSFPSQTMSYDRTLNAMKQLAERISKLTGSYKEAGHPIDINTALEPEYLKAANEVSSQLTLDSPIPKLCTLVTASPFDAAIHDAFGKVHNLNCYHTYGPDFMAHDLSRYLGKMFKGEFLERYVKKDPSERMLLFHSVGAGDPIVEADVKTRLNDGLPETLPEWIRYNGLKGIKIKLNGEDLKADLERVARIDQAAAETQQQRGVVEWSYCLDFNERCPSVEALLEFLTGLKQRAPSGFQKILYIEQPTARDLKTHRSMVMHEAAKLRPVVIDESLTDYEALLLAKDMGYTGLALKACKGQSQAMLMAAAGQKHKMFLCVQDLTCPGASLVHSAGLAAHVPGVSGIEANSREYVPAANKPWVERFPGLFRISDGMLVTAALTHRGLGAVDD